MRRVHRNHPGLALVVVLCGLAACTPFWKKNGPPKATVSENIAPHETWCYKTWDAPQCFSTPQKSLPADLLVMVDPPSRYPLNPDEYRKAVDAAEAAENEKKKEGQDNAAPIVQGPVILTPPGDLSSRR